MGYSHSEDTVHVRVILQHDSVDALTFVCLSSSAIRTVLVSARLEHYRALELILENNAPSESMIPNSLLM